MKVVFATALILALRLSARHGAAATLLRRQAAVAAPVFESGPSPIQNATDPFIGDPVLGAVASMAGGDFFTEAWAGENTGDHTRGSGGCTGWRRTLKCDPSGPRNPQQDKACGEVIQTEESGFCECGDYAQFATVDCNHRPFTCDIMCVKYAIVTGKQAVFKGKMMNDMEARALLDRDMWAQQTDLTAMRQIVTEMQNFMTAGQQLTNSEGKQAVEAVHKYLDEMKKAQAHDKAQALKEMEAYRQSIRDRPWVQIWRAGRQLEAAGKGIQAKVDEILPFDPLSAHTDQEADMALANR